MPNQESPADAGQPKTPAVPIVAIGASAGGLEAVSELLTHLAPATGLAYVYVQHLDQHQESNLSAILSRVTAMPVQEAEHLLPIEPNHVYIIPPDKDMESVDGVLMLMPRQRTGDPGQTGRHLPIDQFFISLAQRQRDGSIGILLSGMASDGTVGMRAIKAAGGITFAQNESARFQSMPRSAIAEGVVDRVLSPTEIAKELEQISLRPDIFRQTERAEEGEGTEATAAEASSTAPEPDDSLGVSDDDVKKIITLLRKAVGVDFSHYKMTTIRRRMLRRMVLFRLETLPEYEQYLRQHPEEIEALYNDLLINVTTFFRDEDTMDHLKKTLLPRVIKDKSPREPLRIWVPACSTGQEAYSIAMLLLEVLGDRAASVPIQIFATDLSEAAIAKARQGSYSRGEVVDVSPKRLQRFFTRLDDHYRISKTVRDLCVFAPQNILKDPPFSRLDLISCRNLLIYLDNVFQRKAIALFHYALNPTGYLLLGKSETVGNSTPLFAQVEKNVKVYARRNDSSDNRALFEMNPRGLGHDADASPPTNPTDMDATGPPEPNRPGRGPNPKTNLEKTVDELLLRQYVPPSVVVNQDLDILQFRGSTGLYLEPAPGKASLNLLKMARPSLAFELRNTIHKAQKAGQPVRKTGLEVKLNDQTHHVAIEAVPLPGNPEEPLFLILFSEVPPVVVAGTDAADASNQRAKQLEDELATLREDMRSIVEAQEASNEELQSANEEIISSNEELQSINEELETSKEEIESTNEELLTINQELQVRNDQLSEANEFSEIIFATIREATLVLDEDLRVKSANPTFYRLFQVTEAETEGRLIYELGNRQWNIPQLRTLLTDVITQNAHVDGFEVSHTFADIGEKVLRLNARRVVRQQESILLAIEDITDYRQSQRLLAEREAWMHNLVDNVPVLIWVADATGRYTFFNQAWTEYTGQSVDESTGRGWEHDIHPDDRENYRRTYDSAFDQQQAFQFEFRLRRHDGEYRWMLVNAKPKYDLNEQFEGFTGTCAEIYNRRTLTQALDLRAQQRTQEMFDANSELEHAQRELARTGPDPIEQELAREQLRHSEDQLRTLIENTPDIITRWDRNRRLIFANSVFETKTGVANIHLLGKTNAEMGQPAQIAGPYMDKIQQVIDTGQPQSHYNSFPTPQGVAYFYSTMVPEFGPDGAVQSVLVIARDITDFKLVEEIQQTAKNLQAVLDSSQAAIGLFKPVRNGQYEITDFQLMVCNGKFADLVQQPMSELPGQSVGRLAGSLWQEDTLAALNRVLTTGTPTYQERANATENDWMGISATKYDDAVVLMGLDITALKQAGQQQEQLLREIEQSQESIVALEQMRSQVRERGEFLRSTTHDLRGSFGVISGAATLLNVMDTEEERAELLTMLQRNLGQVTHLLTQLLDYSRLEAGQEQVQMSEFDLADLLRGLSRSVQPFADQRGLQVRTDGPDHLPVESDAVKVRRIAQNLILNALNYAETGGVTVQWAGDDATGGWEFSVQDTGPGMPPWIASQLTATPELSRKPATGQKAKPDGPKREPAASGPADGESDLSATSGEGIGLVIVRQLCDLLRATVMVESPGGTGTLIRVCFTKTDANGGPLPN